MTNKFAFFQLFLAGALICTCLSGTVHYEGSLAETGEVFDTTHEDNTVFSFEFGKGSVIRAWDIALRTMKVKLCSVDLFSVCSLWGAKFLLLIRF